MIRKLILIALPLLVSCGSPAQADESAAVDRAVGALYAPYQAASPDWDKVRERQIYTQSTEALVKKWEAGLPPDEVEDPADFDWLCECQDWESAAFKFTIAPHGEPRDGRLVVTANVDPGFTTWRKTIGPNVLEYIPSSAKIAEMVQTNEAAVFPLTPTGVGSLKAKGIPVEYAQPKEGSVVLMVGECVVAKNPDNEAAQKLAAYLLGPEAQLAALQYGAQIPSNTKVTPPAEVADEMNKFQGYMKNAVTVDWDVINEKRPD